MYVVKYIHLLLVQNEHRYTRVFICHLYQSTIYYLYKRIHSRKDESLKTTKRSYIELDSDLREIAHVALDPIPTASLVRRRRRRRRLRWSRCVHVKTRCKACVQTHARGSQHNR